jgi:hypothetical protein
MGSEGRRFGLRVVALERLVHHSRRGWTCSLRALMQLQMKSGGRRSSVPTVVADICFVPLAIWNVLFKLSISLSIGGETSHDAVKTVCCTVLLTSISYPLCQGHKNLCLQPQYVEWVEQAILGRTVPVQQTETRETHTRPAYCGIRHAKPIRIRRLLDSERLCDAEYDSSNQGLCSIHLFSLRECIIP